MTGAITWVLIVVIALILIAAIALGLGGSAKEPPPQPRPPPAPDVGELVDGLEQIQQQLADLLEHAQQSRNVLAIAELRHIGIRIEFALRALEPR